MIESDSGTPDGTCESNQTKPDVQELLNIWLSNTVEAAR